VVICEDPVSCHINPSNRRNVLLIAVFVLLWAGPMLMLYCFSGAPVFFKEGLFFTKAAFLTFGGAYAVLPYIAQAGVEQYAWLTGAQMIDGLGLAETTPWPLIMVVQFIGFLAAGLSGCSEPSYSDHQLRPRISHSCRALSLSAPRIENLGTELTSPFQHHRRSGGSPNWRYGLECIDAC
jgi:hypothetical protein